jgi:hypothetical protein
VIRESLIEEMTFEWRRESKPCGYMRKNLTDTESGKCKGPVAGAYLVNSNHPKGTI